MMSLKRYPLLLETGHKTGKCEAIPIQRKVAKKRSTTINRTIYYAVMLKLLELGLKQHIDRRLYVKEGEKIEVE